MTIDITYTDRAEALARRMAQAIGLEESETHRRVWNHLCFNILSGPAVWPDGDGVQLNGNHVNGGTFKIRLIWLSGSTLPVACVYDDRSGIPANALPWLGRIDAALDGMLTLALRNCWQDRVAGRIADCRDGLDGPWPWQIERDWLPNDDEWDAA